jgi:hypothetical protein
MLLSVAAMIVFISAISISADWPFGARIVPQVVAYTALICISASLAFEMFAVRSALAAEQTPDGQRATEPELDERERVSRSGIFFLWVCGYLGLSIALGMLPALFAFVLLCMRLWGREPWLRSVVLAVCSTLFAWVLFDRFLAVPWPQSLIGSWFPALQAYLP